MVSEYSPFTPGQPVSPELFVGRSVEVERLAGYAADAANDRFQVAFLSGERGIGKSSIASVIRSIVEHRYNMLTVHVFLAGVTSTEKAVELVFDRLLKDSQDSNWYTEIEDLFKKQVTEVGLFGARVGFAPKPDALQQITQSFDEALATIYDRISGHSQGIMLVLDDINGLARSDEFANWLKSFVDTVATAKKPLPLFLLLVGLEERRRELIANHESLARVFHLVDIRPWSDEEAEEFFVRTFTSVGMTFADDALDFLVNYTGGLPVLGHEIGDAVFRVMEGEVVGHKTVLSGVVRAARIVGSKHIEPTVIEAIRSAKYRSILRKVSAKDMVFKRSEVLEELGSGERSVLDNFLRKMRDLGVLEQVPDHGPGYWRFTSVLHRLYFILTSRIDDVGG